MAGSIRRRGRDSWQLRVYRGVDGNGRPRWITTTVHGSRRYAEQRLAELVVEVGHARLRSGSVGELLERWFAAAQPRWAATTTAQTRSIINCHLAPELGHWFLAVGRTHNPALTRKWKLPVPTDTSRVRRMRAALS